MEGLRVINEIQGSNTVLIDPRYRWERSNMDGISVHHVGREESFSCILRLLADGRSPDLKAVERELDSMEGCYGFLAESAGWVLAAVDKIRSFPIFYFSSDNHFLVSNSARELRGSLRLEKVDQDSILELRMTTFVTGNRTIYDNLRQLRPGEMLFYDKKSGEYFLRRYYRFLSLDKFKYAESNLLQDLELMTNCIFSRYVKKANGRPLLVPLSGGLDSRLVLCKLKELNCPNLFSFSYGVSGNHEAGLAKKVAKALGVPWHFEPVSRKDSMDYFWNGIRREYFDFSDGLCSLPFSQDAVVLDLMRKRGTLPENAVIVNGQSGDFITGGHLKGDVGNTMSMKEAIDVIINGHYNMWRHLMTPENLDMAASRIRGVFAETGKWDEEAVPTSLLEYWEWQERQSKFVVNGQRAYDFFGLDWILPLWDREYLDYWQKIPLKLKVDQYLYKRYLQTGHRFAELFRTIPSTVWRWPASTILVVPLARAVGLFSRRGKESIYRWAKYFGHYRFGYIMPYSTYLRYSRDARNVESFYLDVWMRENLGINLSL